MANSRGWRKKTVEAPSASSAFDNHEVAYVAYELYEQRGRVDGHALEDWLRAEVIVRERVNRR